MKTYAQFLLFIFLFGSCQKKESGLVKEDWTPLFNGKDLSGWTIKIADMPLNENFKNTFQVEDSLVRIVYDEYEDFDDRYGHMYYKTPYSHYKL